MSSGELDSYLFLCGNLALHPGVANDISHAEALVRVKLEHARDQVFELIREEAFGLSGRMSLPEKVRPVCG